MVVSVRLFAMLRERAGSEEVRVELPEGATVQEAIAAVSSRHGLADLIGSTSVVMAVNREYADGDERLSEGDELALIPPVSGGAGGAGAEANTRPAGSGGAGGAGAEANTRPAGSGGAGGAGAEANTRPAGSGGAEATASHFSTGEGYADFMELVGRHVPGLPGYVELLGMRPLAAEPGHVRMEFTATEQFLNPAGAVQGGFITAMLDDTMGPAAIAQLGPGHFAPTLELKVSFLRPAGPGRLVADGRVVQLGRSVAFLEGSLADGDGNLVATATATARVVRLDPAP